MRRIRRELLGQEAFGTLLGAVREHYDYIIVDTPPIGSIIDAAIVAKQCDGAVLVFESELVSSKGGGSSQRTASDDRVQTDRSRA